MPLVAEAALLAALAVYVGGMLWGALKDVTSYEIPNEVSIAVAAAFAPAALAAGLPLSEIALAVAVAAGCLVVGIGLFAVGLFGGGDVKLLCAGAIWAGDGRVLEYLVVIALAGGVLSLALVAFRRLPLPAPLRRAGWLRALHEPGAGVPYGLAIAAGAIALLPRLDVLAPLADGRVVSLLGRLA
jgi:prepilin peptidase CpaA